MPRHVDDVEQANVRALAPARDDGRVRDTPVATPPRPHIAVAVASILNKLDEIGKRITDQLLDSEQEPDFDQTFVAYSGNAYSSVQITLPRTIRHAEITLSPSLGGVVAYLMMGNVTAANAQAIATNGGPGLLPIIAVVQTNTVTVRTYLDQSGVLSVCFSGATYSFLNVRVRNLDNTQSRLQRT